MRALSPGNVRKSARTLLFLPLALAAACESPSTGPSAELQPRLDAAVSGNAPIEFVVRTTGGQPVPNAWVGLYDGANPPIFQQANATGGVRFVAPPGNYGFTVREIPPEWFGIRTLVPPGMSPAPSGVLFGNLAAVVCAAGGQAVVFDVAAFRQCIAQRYLAHGDLATVVAVTLPQLALRPVAVTDPNGQPLGNANVYLVEKIPPVGPGPAVPWQPSLGPGVEVGFFKFFARTDGSGTAMLPGAGGQLEVYEIVNGVEIAGTVENLAPGSAPARVSTSPVVCIDPAAPPSSYSASYQPGARGVDFLSSMWAFAGTRGSFSNAVLPDASRAAVVLFFRGTGNFTWIFRLHTGGVSKEFAEAYVSCVDGSCTWQIYNKQGGALGLRVEQPQPGKLFATLVGIPAGADLFWRAKAAADAVPEAAQANAIGFHTFTAFSTCAVDLSFDASIWCDT